MTVSSFLLTPGEWTALWLSVKVGLASVALSLIPGIAIAWLLARRRFPGKTALDALVHLPLVLPPVVTGYLLLLALGRRGIVGGFLHDHFGLDIAFTWRAAVLASAAMGFPLLVRSVRLAVEMVDRRLEEAAQTLGASPFQMFFRLVLPLAAPGLLTGIVLAFARSLGEFGATITFAGDIPGQSRTLPVAIYSYLQLPSGDAPAQRLVIISLVLSLGALAASEALARKARRRAGGEAHA